MSGEIARVLHEYGITPGLDSVVGKADRQLMIDALRAYGEQLAITAVTVRTVKPDGVDRRAVAGHLDTVSARVNLLANVIDTSAAVRIVNCGEVNPEE